MQVFVYLTAAACLMTRAVYSRNVVEMEAGKDMKEANQDKVIQEVLQMLAKPSSQGNVAEVNGFSWSDCGTASDLVKLSKLSLTPDPLKFPGNLSVAATFGVSQDLTSGLSVKLKVEKKELGIFIEIPCIDNVGSCTYEDVCQRFATLKDNCPQQLIDIGIKCQCPIAKNQYTFPEASFYVNTDVIPSGEYKIEATLMKGGSEAACVKLELEVRVFVPTVKF